MRRRYSATGLSRPGCASKTTRWQQLPPSSLREAAVAARCPAANRDSVNFFNFVAAENPRKSKIQHGCAADQSGKNDQLNEKARVHGKCGAVIGNPTDHGH